MRCFLIFIKDNRDCVLRRSVLIDFDSALICALSLRSARTSSKLEYYWRVIAASWYHNLNIIWKIFKSELEQICNTFSNLSWTFDIEKRRVEEDILSKSINSFSFASIVLKNSIVNVSARAKEEITNSKDVISSLIIDLFWSKISISIDSYSSATCKSL